MRKLTKVLIVFCLLLAQQMIASEITQDEASQAALSFLKQRVEAMKSSGRKQAQSSKIVLNLAVAEKNYYVFNVGQSDGFVMVSGNDSGPSILGFSDKGSFDMSDIPENMRNWLKDYDRQLEYLKDHPDASVLNSTLDEHDAIQPLLTSQWNQGYPYNNMCPYDGSERSVTGCVATAMAQVLYYHQHPAATTTTIPAYTTRSKSIAVDEIGVTTIDWENMKASYTGRETQAENNAVAQLMLLCGSSVQMDYSSTGSGAMSHDVANALKKYFDYDLSTTYESRGDYRANEWNNMVYEELANKRPVCYGGQSLGGGHAFVIDGYDKDGMFHVNWGWGGVCDAYFLLSVLDPENNSGIGASSSADGYSFAQDAIFGAQPNKGTTDEKLRITTYDITISETTTQVIDNTGFPISFTVSMFNEEGDSRAYDIGMGVFNANDSLVYSVLIYQAEFNHYWGFNDLEIKDTIPMLSDGNYSICMLSRQQGTDIWYKNFDSETYFISATIASNTIHLQEPVFNLKGDIVFSGEQQVDAPLNVTATIKNEGTRFFGELFMSVNDSRVGGRHIEVEPGDSATFTMNFTPGADGLYEVSIGYDRKKYDSEQGYVTKYVEVVHTNINIGDVACHGDANGDNQVTMSDVVLMVSHILGTNETAIDTENADMNGDGMVTMGDVVNVLKIVLGQ